MGNPDEKKGDEAGARLAMTQAVQLEKLLPQIADRLHQAQDFLQASEERLQRETNEAHPTCLGRGGGVGANLRLYESTGHTNKPSF